MKKLRMLNILLMLCLALALPVSAARPGSLEICDVKSPAVIYHVADAAGAPTQAFAGALTENMTEENFSAEAAKQLQAYAKAENIPGQTGTPNDDSLISFPTLEEGCYLICSTAEAGEFAPFLIRIPMTIGGKPVYDIQASPKADTPEDPAGPGKPAEPQPDIPQTGAILWPKYLMLILGGAAIVLGFVEVLRGREKQYE